jgi:group II intron reverse transcriptase/maturase
LIDKVYSRTNRALAWEKVKQNHGRAGIDAVTITEFEANKEFHLERLHRELREGTSQPQPVKRVEIGKSDGGVRKRGIPASIDRVCQQALVQRLEPIFEPQMQDCSFGYRKGRSPQDAMRRVGQGLKAGYGWGVDADLRAFFDTIPQNNLVDLIAEEISDGRGLQLSWAMLRAGAMQGAYWEPPLTGVPQGAVVSPLWSNIFLTPLERAMTAAGFHLTRWADDFVVVCKTRDEAQRALAFAERFLREELGVTLHPQKTRLVHLSQGFEFLGYKVKQGQGFRRAAHKRRSRANPLNLYAVPREKSVKRFKDHIRQLTRRNAPVKLQEVIQQVNPVIRGWGPSYRKAHVRRLFHHLDRWIEHRLYSCRAKRWRNARGRRYPTARLIGEVGLVRLTHLVPGLVQR